MTGEPQQTGAPATARQRGPGPCTGWGLAPGAREPVVPPREVEEVPAGYPERQPPGLRGGAASRVRLSCACPSFGPATGSRRSQSRDALDLGHGVRLQPHATEGAVGACMAAVVTPTRREAEHRFLAPLDAEEAASLVRTLRLLLEPHGPRE